MPGAWLEQSQFIAESCQSSMLIRIVGHTWTVLRAVWLDYGVVWFCFITLLDVLYCNKVWHQTNIIHSSSISTLNFIKLLTIHLFNYLNPTAGFWHHCDEKTNKQTKKETIPTPSCLSHSNKTTTVRLRPFIHPCAYFKSNIYSRAIILHHSSTNNLVP